mgnify:CR=1 FL=1
MIAGSRCVSRDIETVLTAAARIIPVKIIPVRAIKIEMIFESLFLDANHHTQRLLLLQKTSKNRQIYSIFQGKLQFAPESK